MSAEKRTRRALSVLAYVVTEGVVTRALSRGHCHEGVVTRALSQRALALRAGCPVRILGALVALLGGLVVLGPAKGGSHQAYSSSIKKITKVCLPDVKDLGKAD